MSSMDGSENNGDAGERRLVLDVEIFEPIEVMTNFLVGCTRATTELFYHIDDGSSSENYKDKLEEIKNEVPTCMKGSYDEVADILKTSMDRLSFDSNIEVTRDDKIMKYASNLVSSCNINTSKFSDAINSMDKSVVKNAFLLAYGSELSDEHLERALEIVTRGCSENNAESSEEEIIYVNQSSSED